MTKAIEKALWSCAVLAVAGTTAGCAAPTSSGPTEKTATSREALSSGNGLWGNGLATNGLWGNGLWGNGLWGNGLWGNGLWGNGLWGNGLATNGLWGNGLWGNGLWGNGLWGNGLWGNGLWGNGLWGNGLWGNGLWGNGLSTGGGAPLAGSPANLLQSSKYLRELLQYTYQCAMPGPLDPITNQPKRDPNTNQPDPTTYNTTLDPWGGTLLCTPPGDGGAEAGAGGGPACPDSTYVCSANGANGTCVIPLNGAIGVAINADGSSWWGEAADGTFPDYTKSAVGGLAGTCDESCQRWVSACVLARTNAYGVHVEISMRAPANAPQAIKNALATSQSVNGAPAEATLFANREGAYYGNIFETTPVPKTPPPSLPDGGAYSGPATGLIAETPIYTACAGPDSNVPEITKRFESSQGNQVVINVPGVCLATATEPGACAGVDTDSSSPTYQSIQHCYTSTSATSANACAKITGPQGVAEPGDPTCYDEVITVFLEQPMVVCGNGVCEPPSETPTCCPADCHPATWAKDFPPPLQTGGAYPLPACTGASAANGQCPAPPPIEFAPNAMAALATDSTVAVVGNASVDICPGPGCAMSLGNAVLPADAGIGVLVKYNPDGSYAWPSANASTPVAAVRFGSTPPSGYEPLQGVLGVVMGTNASSPATSPDHEGNVTVAGTTTQTATGNPALWISSFGQDGTPLGTWIPQISGGANLAPYGGALAFDSQGNLVLAVAATNPTAALSGATTISPGGGGSCALMATGSVECWGSNAYGQLGTGSTSGPSSCSNGDPCSLTPVAVSGLSGKATAVAGGGNYSGKGFHCALIADGSVECWGSNGFGQLGNGSTTDSPVPVAVRGLTGPVTAIFAGGYYGFVCALISGGTVDCWGDNSFGELGNGGTTTNSATAVPVTGLTGVTAISAGDWSACALLSNGTVDCWGDNGSGELGTGSSTGPSTCPGSNSGSCSLTPVPVSGLSAVASAVSVGNGMACAALSDGRVQCWGFDSGGELGNGSFSSPTTCQNGDPCSPTPVFVNDLTNTTILTGAKTVAVGNGFACALISDGTVDCWGYSPYLGNGSDFSSAFSQPWPVAVSGLNGAAAAVVANDAFVCALMSGGTMQCWGSEVDGSLGAGTESPSSVATAVNAAPLNEQTNTFVLKTALLPGVPQAPVLWTAGVGVGDTSNYPQSLALGPNDDIVLVTSDTTGGSSQGTLWRICSNGSMTGTCPSPDTSQPWSIAGSFTAAMVDSSSNIYAAGVTSSNGTGGPVVQKFDRNGTSQWPATANSSTEVCPYLGSSVANSCTSDPAVQGIRMGFDGGNNIILASFGNPAIGGGINFGPNKFPTFPTYGAPNIFLSAYDPASGTLQWAKQVQTILSGSLRGLALGNQGQIIVAGNYAGSMEVDGQLLITADSKDPTVVDSFLASFAEPAPFTPTIGTGSTCGGPPFDTVPGDIYVPATSPAGACVFYTPPTATGATVVCTQTAPPPPNTTYTPFPFASPDTIFPIGSTSVTCTAYDAYGNSASAAPFTVTVFDPPPALINVPASITLPAPVGSSGATITYTPPTVIDTLNNPTSCSSCAPLAPGSPAPGPPPPCAPPTVLATCSPGSGSTFAIGTTTVTCWDSRNTMTSASFTVTVNDTTPPVVTVPQPIPTPAAGPGGASVTFSATATDLVDGTDSVTCTTSSGSTVTSGSTFAVGTTTVTCTSTDKEGLTSVPTTFTVTVTDVPPVPTVPSNITVPATGPGGASVTFSASATDVVDGTDPITCNPPSGSTFGIGTTTVTCTATDTHQSSSSAIFTITVVDTPPKVTVPADIATPATGPSGAVVTFSVSATDFADGTDAVTCNPASGSTFPIATTTVSCSATNKAKMTTTATFTVTVTDLTPPVLTLPSNITATATVPSGAVVTFSATATDLVDGTDPVTCKPASGSTFPFGQTIVTCTVTDKHRNTTSASFPVTVSPGTGLVMLDPSASKALQLSGTASLQVKSGNIYVDSSSADAADLSGSARLTMSSLFLSGGDHLSGTASISGSVVKGSAHVPDPLAWLPVPSTSGLTVQSTSSLSIGGSQKLVLSPGLYEGAIQIVGNSVVSLNPGMYYLQGGLTLSNSASLSAKGVFLYNASTSSGINVSGSGSVTVTPMTTGTYAGVAIFENRTSSGAITLSSSGTMSVHGTIYAAGAPLTLSGGTSDPTLGTLDVARTITITGSGAAVVSP